MLDLIGLKDALQIIINITPKGSIANNQANYWLAKVKEEIEKQEWKTVHDRPSWEE